MSCINLTVDAINVQRWLFIAVPCFLYHIVTIVAVPTILLIVECPTYQSESIEAIAHTLAKKVVYTKHGPGMQFLVGVCIVGCVRMCMKNLFGVLSAVLKSHGLKNEISLQKNVAKTCKFG